MNTAKTGAHGEDLCANYLVEKGFSILTKNYRFGKNEVDIIGKLNDAIVFVEVKYRADDYIMAPWQAVTRKKQRQIIRVANQYLQNGAIELEARFDVVSIVQSPLGLRIDHIEDAFYPIA
jgi:putative endonuclease